MLWAPESVDHAEMTTDAVLDALIKHGAAGVTIRAVADELGLTPAALSLRYKSRQLLLATAFHRASRRLRGAILVETQTLGLVGLIPSRTYEGSLSDPSYYSLPVGTPEQAWRAWRAFGELAHTEPLLGERLAEHRAWETALTTQTGGDVMDEQRTAWLVACVEGLRSTLGNPGGPTLDVCREMLTAELSRLGMAQRRLEGLFPI